MSNKPHLFVGQPIVVQVQDLSQETKDMTVKVAIETTFLGWLCAATGLTPKVAMCHLYDLTTLPLENLFARNGTWVSRKVDFPNSNIKLKVVCSKFYDRTAYWRSVADWEKRCKAETGLAPYDNRPWVSANPRPTGDGPDINYIKCKFSIVGQDKEIVLSQHEMENLVTETLLLGADDGE